MDDGKPKWWSRPAPVSPPEPAGAGPVEDVRPQEAGSGAAAHGSGDPGSPGGTGGPQPLHEPDEYRTPPYGEPGPWALAPPVQAPVHGAGPQPPAGQWAQYDPWSSPGAVAAQKGAASRSRRGLGLIAALVFALLAGVLGGAVGSYIERSGGLTTVELPQADAEVADRAPDSVAGIAARALPSVVTLHVSGGGEQGTGTGFVLDRRGHILTNHHVVDAAGTTGRITVTFSGGETARATLVGKDSGYDLAVVRVHGVSNLTPLPLGNSDSVQVGDPVVAIGAPFDLQNTVTSGIISAKGRPITAGGEKGDGSDVSYVDALQTDAPINPGNSGGPLLDSKARVVGINSAIRAAGDGGDADRAQAGSIGLGFAIPINQGKRVAEELIETGRATHPVIGVSLDMQYTGDGARVADEARDGGPSVVSGGPAAAAGVKPGDVIVRAGDERVHSGEELIIKIRAHRPGDKLRLTLRRDGREVVKTLTLGSSGGS
ncbi:trypsin-like peptidase domain-containing protein [Streptomyces sp. MUM 203J]|uniref:S1C family serine protease n=1 Tax=Streptomyces sp. MUM 203J TaxID=2791990 RepID=UPI001F045A85|nr:trypsin-like peptidase domain-containing protein [Streptomyces sp. MUM 203J]MCH0540066.1 trypsin-like peptidase domain-containing protein [Streptomyces sp. MUM 203J]